MFFFTFQKVKLFLIEVSLICNIILVSGVQHSNLTFIYHIRDQHKKSSNHLSLCSYWDIIDCICCAVLTFLWLTYNYKLVPFNPLHLFSHHPHCPTLWQPSVCSLYLQVLFCFVLFVSLFYLSYFHSTDKWSDTVFVFLRLFLLSIIHSKSHSSAYVFVK